MYNNTPAGWTQPAKHLRDTYIAVFFRSTVVKTGSGDSRQTKSDSDLSNGGENTPKTVYY